MTQALENHIKMLQDRIQELQATDVRALQNKIREQQLTIDAYRERLNIIAEIAQEKI